MKHPSIGSLEIENLGQLALTDDAVVFVVGPNDGGKSTFLRDLLSSTRKHAQALWIKGLSWNLGTESDYDSFIQAEFDDDPDERFIVHRSSRQRFGAHDVRGFFGAQKTGDPSFLIRLLDASTRITLADPTNSTDVTTKQVSHPYHRFFYDTKLEASSSSKVRAAFGTDFRVNRTGSTTAGFLGEAPVGDRLSDEYELSIITTMQPIQNAGDGIRSYTGILLNASADQRPVTLIDEPEAFLHPPQARKLGRELALEAKKTQRQTFIATHSTDVIQGALSSDNRNIHLVYLNRRGSSKAHFISREVVNEFSDSPFLAQTNALDALFFERVIICEAPADIMFFRWALQGTAAASLSGDALWLAGYGKSAMPSMVADIHKLGVTTSCIFDIDVLLSLDIVEKICAQFEMEFSRFEGTLKALQKGIRVPPVADTLEKIEAALKGLPEEAEIDEDGSRAAAVARIKRLTNNLGKSWVLKSSGMAAVPKGQLFADVQGMLDEFRGAGIVILAEGEIENYFPQIATHGPAWVRSVIEANAMEPTVKEKIAAYFR